MVSKIKNIPLSGVLSHDKMSPPFRLSLQAQNSDKMLSAKSAGVMVLFYPNKNNITEFMLILRKTYRGVHSAQIGFPGGKYEPEDLSMVDTALRETFEEVGVNHNQIEVLRALTKVYIPPSNFFVYPFIGFVKTTPNFVKQNSEVEALIPVTLSNLLDPKNVVTKTVSASYKKNIEVPGFLLKKQFVWGATAMMLNEVKELLNYAVKY